VIVACDLGAGTGVGEAWGCDLTEGYVKINAEYTT
jgi:glutamate N-acetyltransferase / amino-acid N-acetyltransferase